MVFQCQRDSFKKEYLTRIDTVEEKDGMLEVTTLDTILFPEGGGQPNDLGFFVKTSDQTKLPVKNVIRKGPKAIHILDATSELKKDEEILQIVDWERRFDHMQQHSGQHLITALFEREFNYPTKAWWLGSETSYIELDGNPEPADLSKIELLCNNYIFQALPVKVEIYERPEDADESVTRASRGLPEDLCGPIRVIKIEGIDANMCCGTHISNLTQLQVIKLLNIEKTKGKVFVHFLVGNRVIQKLDAAFQREMTFTALLNGGAESHVDLVKKLQTTAKQSQKTIQKMSKELATILAEKLSSEENPPPYYFLHRNDGSQMDFANTFLRVAKPKKQILFFITISDAIDSKSGSLILQGNAADVETLAPSIFEILEGKGNGKNGRYQAKVTKLNKIKECEALIQKHFEELK